jgi:hypothetical protein
VPVVGAWTWLPEYEIGVTTEVDVAQAFRPIVILQRTFWTLYGLLIVTSIAIFVFTLVVAHLRRKAQTAAIEAKQLGQYTLEQKLGAGAMGVVYKGHHAMLRRKSAIKMLDVETVNDASIARFEREVQITCQLNHPNTIAIYDYGRTPEDVLLLRHGISGRYRPAGTCRKIRSTARAPSHPHSAAGLRFTA